MAAKSAFSIVGLAHKLCLALEAQGFTPELLNALAENTSLLGDLRRVQLGLSEIKPVAHAIDCDADPFLPKDTEVEQHKKGGTIIWDAKRASLYRYSLQKRVVGIEGVALRRVMTDLSVLNANVLDYLLKNPHLIPEEWKSKDVFFWGTVYRSSLGDLWVRYLYWNGYRWIGHYRLLIDQFGCDSPAALYNGPATLPMS